MWGVEKSGRQQLFFYWHHPHRNTWKTQKFLPNGFTMCSLSNNWVTECEVVRPSLTFSAWREQLASDETWPRSFEPELKSQSAECLGRSNQQPSKAIRSVSCVRSMHIVFLKLMGSSLTMQYQLEQLLKGITSPDWSAISCARSSVGNGLICCNQDRSSVKKWAPAPVPT